MARMDKETREKYKDNLNKKIELMAGFDAIREEKEKHKKRWNELKQLWRVNEEELKAYPKLNTDPDQLNYWDGKFHVKELTKTHKICICTNVMNRLKDISRTLPANIEALKDYPDIEFNLLNYGDTSGLDQWVKKNMMPHIESGILKYYRVLDEISHYSMGHSRNICMRLAGGLDNASHNIIVNQVDADNYLKHKDPEHMTFPEYVNKLAHELPEKAIFGKGHRLMNGRIGFYKDEFLMLGGYDEGLSGYGHDDRDLYNRAMSLGYSLAWYGGQYVNRIHTPRESKVKNMKQKDWRFTEEMNKLISLDSLEEGRFVANIQTHWGKAKVLKNFEEEIDM
jgi:hypothetical protein